MYKKVNYVKSVYEREYTEGETIEQKIRRITNNNDPIKDGAPLVYTERKDGVKPEYDIRTDRFDIALDAMDKVSRTNIAKREARMNIVKDTEGESSNGTDVK